MTYTSERIARERAICDAATPGPWLESWVEEGGEGVPTTTIVDRDGYELHHMYDYMDVLFAITARASLPEALDEITRLRRILNTIARCCGPIESQNDQVLAIYEIAVETLTRSDDGGAP